MQTEQAERVLRRATENLYEDEHLRSDMSDSEASIVLNWAAHWLQVKLEGLVNATNAQKVLQDETSRVRQAIMSFNELAKKPGTIRLGDALSILESSVQTESFDRDQMFRLLTELTTTIWNMRAAPSNSQSAVLDEEMSI